MTPVNKSLRNRNPSLPLLSVHDTNLEKVTDVLELCETRRRQ